MMRAGRPPAAIIAAPPRTAAGWAAQAVAKGAAVMDERKPGWRKRVNLEAFSVASVRSCVLGQCYGSFNAGTEALGLGRVGAAELGFIWQIGQVDNADLISALDEAWRAQITGKRAGGEPA